MGKTFGTATLLVTLYSILYRVKTSNCVNRSCKYHTGTGLNIVNEWLSNKSLLGWFDEVCHGIPDLRPLLSGDIINVDITVYAHGFHGDCSATFQVTPPALRSRPESSFFCRVVYQWSGECGYHHHRAEVRPPEYTDRPHCSLL